MTDKKITNPCIECGKNFCGAQIEGKTCEAMFYGKREQEMNALEELKNVGLGEKIGYKKGFEAARKQFERPQGEWIKDLTENAHCTNCGFVLDTYFMAVFFNYCPNCGADMRPKEGEAE